MTQMLAAQLLSGKDNNTSSPSGAGEPQSSGKSANFSINDPPCRLLITHILKRKDDQALLVSIPSLGPEDNRCVWTTEDFECFDPESQEMLDSVGLKRIEPLTPSKEDQEFSETRFTSNRRLLEKASNDFSFSQRKFRKFRHVVYEDNPDNRHDFPYVFNDVLTDEYGTLLNPGKFFEQFVRDFGSLTNLELKKNKEGTFNDTIAIMDTDVDVPASPAPSATLAGTDTPDTLSNASAEGGWTLG